MMKKMIEMQSKASLAIPRAKPKGNEILKEMMRKLMKMLSKTLLTVPIANPNQDLIEIPLAESERDWTGRVNKENSFYQEPPPRAPIRGIIVFSDGGTVRREFCDRCDEMTEQYGRSFGQDEWTTGEGGQAEPWGSIHVKELLSEVRLEIDSLLLPYSNLKKETISYANLKLTAWFLCAVSGHYMLLGSACCRGPSSGWISVTFLYGWLLNRGGFSGILSLAEWPSSFSFLGYRFGIVAVGLPPLFLYIVADMGHGRG
ncbi:hypothetical protein M5K25_015111 [Dendrobium thyrsiflorum]|uniref:Uncharacterized protein n=1 Tax=Dendrobium thyrsiflorum TaxID=117978 RepID=A0ABD0UQA2_DENTH